MDTIISVEQSALLSANTVIEQLKSDAQGLTDSEVLHRQVEYGPNISTTTNGKFQTFFLFVKQFFSPLVILLGLAVIFSLFIGEYGNALAILAIMVINGILGFFQEYKANKIVSELAALTPQKTLVKRSGQVTEILVEKLVPGDIILLKAGSVIPADARILKSQELETIESILTGESNPQSKTTQTQSGEKITQANLLYQGTQITKGECLAIVVATGHKTKLGKISQLMTVGHDTPTPLQNALTKLSLTIGIVAVIACIPVLLFSLAAGKDLIDSIVLAISLIVSAVPEGLAIVVTLALSFAGIKLVSKKVVVKKLPAVEALGSVDIICADKTGTLTQNKMEVKKIWTPTLKTPSNFIKSMSLNLEFEKLISAMHLCVESYTNDATEIAIKNCIPASIAKKLNGHYSLVHKIPFTSERQFMAVLMKDEAGKNLHFIKGSPEKIIGKASYFYTGRQKSKFSKNQQQAALDTASAMAKQGYRVMAYAVNSESSSSELLDNAGFIGLIGLIDPIRSDALQTVQTAQKAGIDIKILTGDHPETALFVAENVGIGRNIITGDQLSKLTRTQIDEIVESTNIFARILPEQKLQILRVLAANGHRVAMTGDGVNDAPALKEAHVGIALGNSTDLAKESADLILMDDNLAGIVEAIGQGRHTFNNIKLFITYMLAANVDEILLISFALLFNTQLPLLPIHLLWLNIITDGIPALALTKELPQKNIMLNKPTEPTREILLGIAKFTIAAGVIGFICSLAIFIEGYYFLNWTLSETQTAVFTGVIFFELFLAYLIRMRGENNWRKLFENEYLNASFVLAIILQVGIVNAPVLSSFLSITQLNGPQWLIAVLFPGLGIVSMQMIRIMKRRMKWELSV